MRLALCLGLLALACFCLAMAWKGVAVRDALAEFRHAVRTRRTGFATLFLLYGLVAVPCLALLMPPYQVSDEGAHFFRADQVELGYPLGYRSGNNSGGIVDQGIGASYSVFYPVVLHPETKVTAEMFDQAAADSWKSTRSFADFSNTAIYPPYFYAVSALGIAIGKIADLPVISTLTLARCLNGLVGLGVGALAISLAGPAAPWFFVLLTLPMTLAQIASVSQDALLFPTAAFAAALFVRLLQGKDYNLSDFVLMCTLLALVSTGRVTYGTLALLPLTVRHFGWKPRLLGAVAVAAAALGWSWIASSFALVRFGLPGANASGQIHHLLASPWTVFSLAVNTIRYQYDLYMESFVGKLGWLDLRLPWAYLVAAWVVIVLAAVASVTDFAPTRRAIAVAGIIVVALLASVAALFAALYISWTPVGNFIVDGIQGRYFIPLAFFLPALFSIGVRPLLGTRVRGVAALVALFPLVTIPTVVTSIVLRYYEG